MIFVLYALIGTFAGFSAGLFGIGGGLIIVPALLPLFAYKAVDPAVSVHLAIGTSLATIVVTALSSIRAHHKKGNVDWAVFKQFGLGLALGAVVGGVTADLTPGPWLKLAFAGFTWAMAARLLLAAAPVATRALPRAPYVVGAGSAIGWISSLFGIGGGAMSVPYLIHHNVDAKRAVGTSAAGGLPIALMGAGTYLVAGWGTPGLPEWSWGYIYLPAFASIVLLSIPFAQLGANVASALSSRMIKRIFAGFLLVVGAVLMVTG
ncbi:TSUP family transporter [Litorivicinus lipolyticus]|uniref:Probable membrane transporter protein n=1 Tax=Litorivicinus lipolyticus TaxID=418701 RepID=A0A5Q2Q5Z9_9GAMM|nr:sulfite exporter TauE/SafE family protein [Litorivicinus lipolyticus]QGG79108.1 TSUP family transporter [Litorivicinus lipolyticus]